MLEVMSEGVESENLQKKKSNLALAPPSKNKQTAETVSEETGSEELSVSNETERERRKEEAPQDLIVIQEENDAEEESHDSNSTDYGYNHG